MEGERLQSDSGNATDIRAFDDDNIIVNLSVWKDLDALRDFVRNRLHLAVLRRRGEWFVPSQVPTLALWWVP
ncbi:MAG: DUF3291 domain-containing protein [Chromatiales bacterium]|nr:DUF3291 domain-containing protein [Chromatiales bacterium]